VNQQIKIYFTGFFNIIVAGSCGIHTGSKVCSEEVLKQCTVSLARAEAAFAEGWTDSTLSWDNIRVQILSGCGCDSGQYEKSLRYYFEKKPEILENIFSEAYSELNK